MRRLYLVSVAALAVIIALLAALLLTNRIVDVGEKPLSAGEFWSLCNAIDDL